MLTIKEELMCLYIFQKIIRFIDECDVRIDHMNKTDIVMHGVEKRI